jgi:hypothetical protein
VYKSTTVSHDVKTTSEHEHEHPSATSSLHHPHHPSSLDEHGHPRIDLSFCSGQEAYRSKTTGELARALLVFNLCSVDVLINYNKQVNLHLQPDFIHDLQLQYTTGRRHAD